jgi:hypothetical protein
MEKKRPKVFIVKLLSKSPLIWAIIFVIFHIIVLGPMAAEAKSEMKDELGTITLPTEVQILRSAVINKKSHVSIINEYVTSLNQKEVFEYYDQELIGKGWQYLSQVNEEDEKKKYCKTYITATIKYYAKKKPTSYTIWLDYGTTSDCEKKKGGGIDLITYYYSWFLFYFSVSWSIYAIIIGMASWRMKRRQFLAFVGSISRGLTGIGKTRIISAVILYVCLIFIVFSSYQIITFLINWY